MKKQYRKEYKSWYETWLVLYHDGIEVERKVLTLEEYYDEAERLEKDGYSYAFTRVELDDVLERARYVQENLLRGGNGK